MSEGRDHGVLRRQGRGTILLQHAPRIVHRVAIALRRVARMQHQVDEAESQLPHLRVGGAESARALHLLEEILGNRLARLIVAREQIERRALPAPVLHDLRGQLDKIPRHAGAGQRADLHPAQQVMQQMAELVENRLHIAMRQQRRLAADRRAEVAADQPQMRLEAARRTGRR